MGNILKVGVSWTPQGIDKTLKTKFSVGVGSLPTQIKITRMPYKLDYKDGESINPAGMIVHAYYEDGTDFGTILESALTLDPLVVDKEEMSKQGGGTYHIFAEPTLAFVSGGAFGTIYYDWFQGSADMRFVFQERKWNFASTDLNAWAKQGLAYSSGVTPGMGDMSCSTITFEGKQYRVCAAPNGRGFSSIEYYVNDLPEGANIFSTEDLIKYTYGDSAIPPGSKVTVKWNRPVDGMELTTTYNINITGDA